MMLSIKSPTIFGTRANLSESFYSKKAADRVFTTKNDPNVYRWSDLYVADLAWSFPIKDEKASQ